MLNIAKTVRRLPRVPERWAISASVNQTIESTVVTEDLRVSTVIIRIRVTLTTEIVFALFPVPLLRLNADTTTKGVLIMPMQHRNHLFVIFVAACESVCTWSAASWDEKCSWRKKCGGCPECPEGGQWLHVWQT